MICMKLDERTVSMGLQGIAVVGGNLCLGMTHRAVRIIIYIYLIHTSRAYYKPPGVHF